MVEEDRSVPSLDRTVSLPLRGERGDFGIKLHVYLADTNKYYNPAALSTVL